MWGTGTGRKRPYETLSERLIAVLAGAGGQQQISLPRSPSPLNITLQPVVNLPT